MEDVRRRLQQDLAIDEIAADRKPTFGFTAQTCHEFAADANRGCAIGRVAFDAGKRLASLTAAAKSRCTELFSLPVTAV